MHLRAYLDSNINADIALVNGSLITLDSLTFDNENDRQNVFEMCNNNSRHKLPYGSELIIPKPTAVNVIVDGVHSKKNKSAKRSKQYDVLINISHQMGINRTTCKDVIIPLTSSTTSKAPLRYTFTLPGSPPSTCFVNIKQPFPYDLAFAMTVHKAQGRTIPRVIIDVRQHPNPMSSMNYAALFVALSRVKQGSHLRLIEPSSTVDTRASIYKWLTTLSPNTDIAPFIHGFLPTQQWQFRRATAHS